MCYREVPPLESENSTCATLRDHLSNRCMSTCSHSHVSVTAVLDTGPVAHAASSSHLLIFICKTATSDISNCAKCMFSQCPLSPSCIPVVAVNGDIKVAIRRPIYLHCLPILPVILHYIRRFPSYPAIVDSRAVISVWKIRMDIIRTVLGWVV